MLAALIAQLRDFDLAEEAFQDAMTEAARVWPRNGVPENGGAWLLTVARRRAIDRLRRASVRNSDMAKAAILQSAETEDVPEGDYVIPDERLRLIFTCCHPALPPEAQVALTLRTLCGLSVREIARAFLTGEPAMQQRLTRAKTKIRGAGIAYTVPEAADIAMRLEPVLAVIYLIYNESYSASEGAAVVRVDLAAEALRLAQILHHLLPHPEVAGLLALMTLHNARRPARLDADGALVMLQDQDRNLWDAAAIAAGKKLLLHTLAQARPGPYQVQAAISALHSGAESWGATDWAQISGLYTALYAMTPSPVVALNRAVAVAKGGDIVAGLRDIMALETALPNYQPYFAARADLQRQTGDMLGAKADYEKAIALGSNVLEQAYLEKQLLKLG